MPVMTETMALTRGVALGVLVFVGVALGALGYGWFIDADPFGHGHEVAQVMEEVWELRDYDPEEALRRAQVLALQLEREGPRRWESAAHHWAEGTQPLWAVARLADDVDDLLSGLSATRDLLAILAGSRRPADHMAVLGLHLQRAQFWRDAGYPSEALRELAQLEEAVTVGEGLALSSVQEDAQRTALWQGALLGIAIQAEELVLRERPPEAREVIDLAGMLLWLEDRRGGQTSQWVMETWFAMEAIEMAREQSGMGYQGEPEGGWDRWRQLRATLPLGSSGQMVQAMRLQFLNALPAAPFEARVKALQRLATWVEDEPDYVCQRPYWVRRFRWLERSPPPGISTRFPCP